MVTLARGYERSDVKAAAELDIDMLVEWAGSVARRTLPNNSAGGFGPESSTDELRDAVLATISRASKAIAAARPLCEGASTDRRAIFAWLTMSAEAIGQPTADADPKRLAARGESRGTGLAWALSSP